MRNDSSQTGYFEWMYDLVYHKRYSGRASYKKLLRYLHSKEFTYTISFDGNRAEDGKDLRYRYSDDVTSDPCSILEMMVALSLRCEEQIMSDDDIGNRTGKWFWLMIENLGLGSMDDQHFDKVHADEIIYRFLHREYASDGTGGLFTIPNCRKNLRKVEIWYQLMWYLNTIT